jgi:hypothetical protein
VHYGINEMIIRYENKKYSFGSLKSRNKEPHVNYSLRKNRKKKQKI